MKLYHGWLSSASRRVRLCLAEKGLPYESVPIDMGRQEHHSPAYLAMNPNGQVPALRLDDGRSLYESSTICEYLDDICPQPPLRPADAYARATMRNFIRWTDEKALPNLLILNWSIALQPGASRWSDEELAAKLARVPTAERREAWSRIARHPYTEEEKRQALAKLLALMTEMEQLFASGGGPWLMGPDYSLADIAAVPFVARITELAPDAVQRHARIAQWWKRATERPAFQQARIERFDVALSRVQNQERSEKQGVDAAVPAAQAPQR
ncbi:glutathione S-transferase family protein [Xenophilus arseniciresistens]|uniref:Glutathione S-transferase family protein n=1 Tax=Xenophilus arseniciresistens TaxID=1283306 RepID=A0AAE3N660_9BURK|nr:glutathione S-transferase family protein [Xenophilus arseniciresistens]MDA7415966.1 glutathione S-transferase family protein [Xenophilus arseniciresistens]